MNKNISLADATPRCLASIGVFQFFIKKIFGIEPAFQGLIPGKIDGLTDREYLLYLKGFAAGQEKMANALQTAYQEQEEFRVVSDQISTECSESLKLRDRLRVLFTNSPQGVFIRASPFE